MSFPQSFPRALFGQTESTHGTKHCTLLFHSAPSMVRAGGVPWAVSLWAVQRKDFFDVIDVDSFGGNTSCLGPALGATVHRGGLLYATSTDGFSTGGHAPLRCAAGPKRSIAPCTGQSRVPAL